MTDISPNAPITVMIATTQGPAEVIQLVSAKGDSAADALRSMLYFEQNGKFVREILGPHMAPNCYDNFVRLETGAIERLFGSAPFIMSVSRTIDSGESWQAGVLLAHAAYARNRLAMAHPPHVRPVVAWVTGIIDVRSFSMKKISGLKEKIITSLPKFAESKRDGVQCILAFMPAENDAELDEILADASLRTQLAEFGVRFVTVASAGEMFEHLHLRGTSEASPYRGLFRFEPQDHTIFFGRREAAKNALKSLIEGYQRGKPFLLISGRSGVGKSSLARAGILGNLAELKGYGEWVPAILDLPAATGESLLSALTKCLCETLADLSIDHADATALAKTDPTRFADAIVQALSFRADAENPRRLILLIDQLERIFPEDFVQWQATPAKQSDDQSAFTKAVAALVESQAVWVVATIRVDFLSKIDDRPELVALIDDRDCILRPPSREELREIICEPMKLWGFAQDSAPDGQDLIETLIDDALMGHGTLPLLEYTLDQLVRKQFEERTFDRVLSYKAYREMGGLIGAVSRLITEDLKALHPGDEVHPDLATLIMSLAQIDRGSRKAIARQAPLTELSEIDPRLIDLLNRRRLIILDGASICVAHEALLTEWDAARKTLENHTEDLILRDWLEEQSKQWESAEQSDKRSYLLRSGRPLGNALDLLQRTRTTLPDTVFNYVKASEELYRREVGIDAARLAADEQRSLNHIKAGEFQEAAGELENIAKYLRGHEETELANRLPEFEERYDRISRLAGFYRAIEESNTLAGEEEFKKALPKLHEALHFLDIGDKNWWNRLPVADITAYPDLIKTLKQDVYRALLLYSAMQLIPGINKVLPPNSGSVFNQIIGKSPSFFLAMLIKNGGLGKHRLPARLDKSDALHEFQNAEKTLQEVRLIETQMAAEHNEPFKPSSSSQFIQTLVDFLKELSSGPKNQPIDYGKWLEPRSDVNSREPTNAVDYFLMGLLNFFVAKRSDSVLPKMLNLARGPFPQVDTRRPLRTAQQLLRIAVALEPKYFWAHWVLGRTLLTAGDYAGAELAFNTAVLLKANYARGYEQRALAFGHQWLSSKDDRLYLRARADSDRARKSANGDPSIFWSRGELFEICGDLKNAIDSYSRWLELEEDIPALIARSSGLIKLDALTTKILHTTKGKQHTDLETDARALRALLRVVRKDKDYEGALSDAETALKSQSRHEHALIVKGIILLHQKRLPKEAHAVLRHLCEANDPNYRALLENAKALEMVMPNLAALAAWRKLSTFSTSTSGDVCPPWMLKEAAEAEDRLSRSTADWN